MPKYPIHGSPFFDVREFVDERTWNLYGVKCAWFVDERAVKIADLVRGKANEVTIINNWFFVRPPERIYDSSGFRAIWDREGGSLSQHRRGCAVDLKVRGSNPKQVFELIMDNELEFKEAGLTTMENIDFTISWNHLDCRPLIPGISPEKGFLIVNP
jgi:hypothetical protein